MEIKVEKLMTDGYITELNPKSGIEPNVNLEDGEYIKTPDGSVAQVLGERHKNGGVNLILPEMTAVLSDTKDLTLEKEQIKRLKKDYGIEASTKHTYSDVLDKFAKKIGLTKLLNEQEDAFTQLKKVTENALSEGSLNVNNQFLQKKIFNLQGGITEKQSAMGAMFDQLFAKQQEAKGEDGQVIEATGNPQEINPNLQGDLTEQQMMKFGGCVGCADNLRKLSQKYNMTPQQAYSILEKRGKLPQYNDGGWIGFNEYQTKYENIPTYKAGELDLQAQRLLSIMEKAGYKPENTSVKTQAEQDALAGQYQTWLYENKPSVAEDYSSNMPPTKAGLEYILNNKIMTEADFQKLGVKVPKNAGKILGLDNGAITQDKINEVNKAIALKLNDPEKKKEYLKKNFVDNKWFFRAPEIQTVQFNSEEEKNTALEGYTDLGDGTYKSKKTGLYFIPEVKKPLDVNTTVPVETGGDTTTIDNTIYDDITIEEQKRNFPRLFHTPDESVPPPIGLQAESMVQKTSELIDPLRVGVEHHIKRGGDALGFVASQLESMPPSQRASNMANVIATNSIMESDAITKANQINAQNLASTELYNAGVRDRDTSENANSILNYEQRALTGLGKTQNEFHNFIMANREVYLNKHKEQEKMNILENLFTDVSIDNYGTGLYYDPSTNFQVQTPNTNYQMAQAYQRMAQAKAEEEKKKKKKDDNA